MKRKNLNEFRRLSLAVLFAILLVVIVLDILLDGRLYPFDLVIMAASAVVWLVLYILYWRCPHCGKWLPRGDGDLSVCPYCGKSLNEKP
jgi:Ca2+/Na+ antiporter